MRKFTPAGVVLVALLLSAMLIPLTAQEEIILTIGVNEWQQDVFDEELLAEFTAQNPGIKVVPIVLPNDRFFGGGILPVPDQTLEESIDEYLEGLNSYVGSADVLPVDSFMLTEEFVRSGALLDIQPLINADPNANMDDFLQPMLESYQWGGATWGLPITGSVNVVIYNREKFDEAGLAYPDETWDIFDYTNAGAQLTEFNDANEVVLPGFFGFDTSAFFYSLLQDSLEDGSFPPLPQYNNPAYLELMQTWEEFNDEYGPDFSANQQFDFMEVPLTISGTFRLENNFGNANADSLGWSLLPGGSSLLNVQGYSVSAATEHPQAAYQLLQFITQNEDLIFRSFGDAPARQSMVGVTPEDAPFTRPDPGETVQAVLEQALPNAIPTSRYRFYSYGFAIQQKMAVDGLSAEEAAIETSNDVAQALQLLDAKASESVVVVATPIPTPVLASGEISLVFGLEQFGGPSQNREEWQALIDEFVANDPEVGQIVLDTAFTQFDERLEEQDCFYLGQNPATFAAVTDLLPIEPFLRADPDFDQNGLVSGVLEPLTANGMIMGMPMAVLPQLMWYNQDLFEEAGIPVPESGWTVSEFELALQALKPTPDDPAPFSSRSFGGAYIEMLVVAYGGLPLVDDSTTPPRFNVDDPATQEAIRRVLDLARDGYIDYNELSSFGGGGFGGQVALYDSLWGFNSFELESRSEDGTGSPMRVVTFPIGSTNIPVSYSVTGGYISSQSQHPEACYRWLSTISQRPSVLSGIPARTALIEQATDAIINGEDVAAFFQEYVQQLASPNTVVIQNGFAGGTSLRESYIQFITRSWVLGVFDAYVLEDADLQAEFDQAIQYVDEFYECTAGIPEADPDLLTRDQEEIEAFLQQFQDCATAIDPETADLFPN